MSGVPCGILPGNPLSPTFVGERVGVRGARWRSQGFLNRACTLLCFQVPASLNSVISIDSAR